MSSDMSVDARLPWVPDHEGSPRVMAALPPKEDFGGFPRFRAAYSLVPRNQWEEVDFSKSYNVPVLDQGNAGSCVGHGSTTAFWFAYLMAGGTVPDGGFSPTSLYAQINGGRDAGAIVSDAMDALMTTGIGLMNDVPESMIYDRQIPSSAKAKYSRFKVSAAYHCATFDEVVSAILRGWPVSFGITIRQPWMNPPASGIIPTGGFPVGGHCTCIYGTKRLSDASWSGLDRNSWGTRYALGGNMIVPQWHFDHGGQLDAFAVQCAQVDPEDPNRPTTATA